MKLAIRVIENNICVCEKGSSRIVTVIGSTITPCDGLISGYSELPINKDEAVKRTYARYKLEAELEKASRQITEGLCPELALFSFKRLFFRQTVSV